MNYFPVIIGNSMHHINGHSFLKNEGVHFKFSPDLALNFLNYVLHYVLYVPCLSDFFTTFRSLARLRVNSGQAEKTKDFT
jgi:hypothetical protein